MLDTITFNEGGNGLCAELKVSVESKLTFLLLRPLSIGPHAVVALNHKIIFVATS